jgi:hypothetical protein
MTDRGRQVPHADHCGSLLRPQELRSAWAAHALGRMGDEELRGGRTDRRSSQPGHVFAPIGARNPAIQCTNRPIRRAWAVDSCDHASRDMTVNCDLGPKSARPGP